MKWSRLNDKPNIRDFILGKVISLPVCNNCDYVFLYYSNLTGKQMESGTGRLWIFAKRYYDFLDLLIRTVVIEDL